MSFVGSISRIVGKIKEQLFEIGADHGLTSVEINYMAVKNYNSIREINETKLRDVAMSNTVVVSDSEAAYSELDSKSRNEFDTALSEQNSQILVENTPDQSTGRKFSIYSALWSFVVAIIITTIIYFTDLEYSVLRSPIIVTGTRIQLKTYDGLYVRVDSASSNYTLIASETIPWILGSTFEVEVISKKKWRLKSLSGNWVRVRPAEDIQSGTSRDEVFADETNVEYATAFIPTRTYFSASIKLMLDSTDLLLSIRDPNPSDFSPFAVLATSTSYTTAESFELLVVEPLHGVNLGGWFIPEVS